MSVELDRLLERVRQNRTAQSEALRDLAAAPSAFVRLTGKQFVAGDRVFDVENGKHGEVQSTNRAGVSGPIVVTVRYDDGSTDKVNAERLIMRPTLPQPQP